MKRIFFVSLLLVLQTNIFGLDFSTSNNIDVEEISKVEFFKSINKKRYSLPKMVGKDTTKIIKKFFLNNNFGFRNKDDGVDSFSIYKYNDSINHIHYLIEAGNCGTGFYYLMNSRGIVENQRMPGCGCLNANLILFTIPCLDEIYNKCDWYSIKNGKIKRIGYLKILSKDYDFCAAPVDINQELINYNDADTFGIPLYYGKDNDFYFVCCNKQLDITQVSVLKYYKVKLKN